VWVRGSARHPFAAPSHTASPLVLAACKPCLPKPLQFHGALGTSSAILAVVNRDRWQRLLTQLIGDERLYVAIKIA